MNEKSNCIITNEKFIRCTISPHSEKQFFEKYTNAKTDILEKFSRRYIKEFQSWIFFTKNSQIDDQSSSFSDIPEMFDEDQDYYTSAKITIDNFLNFRRLSQYKKSFTSQLLSIIRETDLEFGYESAVDRFLRVRLEENSHVTKDWLNSIFIDYIKDINVVIGILRSIAHLDYEDIQPNGPTMAIAALSHKNIEIRECGIRAFESWERLESVPILESVSCPEKWLDDYRLKVISDIKDAHGIFSKEN